jgi:ubiquinone biosynthesis protein
LWNTAHPFLERWIKHHFHPKTLWGELKRFAPEWMEKFPQVPQLVFDSLKQIQHLSEMVPELQKISRELHKKNSNLQYRFLFALILLGGALAWINHW